MKEINLKLTTKTIDCEILKIKTQITPEWGSPEIVIPKEIRKELEGLLIREFKEFLK
jgi:hypothetical protein